MPATLRKPMSAEAKTVPLDSSHQPRRAPRWRLIAPGIINLPGHRLTVPCKIVNTSISGALIELVPTNSRIQNADHIPDRVVVVFSSDRVEMDGEIMWRSRERFGLRFLSSFRPITVR